MRLFALALALATHAAFGQAPTGSDKLSPAAVAESLAVLKQLDSALVKTPNDAAIWYRRGMLAWALAERDRAQPPIPGLDRTLLGHLADTSLRIAAQLPPRRPLYGVMAGRFLLSSGVSITRAASYGIFDDALESARKGGDKTEYAEAAIEAGRARWRRYDTVADAWTPVTGRPCDSTFIIQPGYFVPASKNDTRGGPLSGASMWRSELLTNSMPLPFDVAGESDYLQAEALFKEAFTAQPSMQRAYRQYAMLLVEKNRWTELAAVARTRLTSAPWDAWAWLTLGLAAHRQGHDGIATAAFDSGFAILPPDERHRMDQLERVLTSSDSARVARMDSTTRGGVQDWYWRSADPLWSQPDAEPRIEFLARVTHAELRWTVEEMGVRGADTDRGNVFIRYGPADLVASYIPTPMTPNVCTLWVYNARLVFRFYGAATFATAHFQDYGRALIMIENNPARWDNLDLPRIDTMYSQTARFRARNDSVDIFFAVMPPVDAIRKAAEVVGRVRADYWLVEGSGKVIAHDSVVPAVPGLSVHTRRVSQGAYVYRAEASSDGSRLAGRALSIVLARNDTTTGFTTRGFGMSDVLLAASASSRGTPLRWADLSIHPLLGSTAQKGQISLVWETYELGSEQGAAHYTVSISVERQRSAIGRIAAQIIGRVGSVVGVDRTEDRVTSHYDRSVPYAPVLLDNITLGLGETPAGTYRLTVTIADRVSGRTTSRGMNLTVTAK
jgi:GWxTD domain-containing protein